MPFLHIAVLALVQGLTEFLPVSSSAHLILVPYLTGWPDQGLVIDVAVHVGTLGAVLLYFWRDLGDMVLGLMRLTKGQRDSGRQCIGVDHQSACCFKLLLLSQEGLGVVGCAAEGDHASHSPSLVTGRLAGLRQCGGQLGCWVRVGAVAQHHIQQQHRDLWVGSLFE
ncbi:MAG: Undecaprenyl-diphosphatase [Alphaproteobacteria bacterium MarineAlpha3_Bin3]|nr:MAG: Undecaprenyl-diphosphatase [Alphaproteobacteria bacterium MarineAlpha3_Bin3]